jgi:glycosyltransferase involved in cell wall biosynthesis
MKRLNILLSAYACRPVLGSEPAIGWNVAKELAKHHNVWVLTRSNNRLAIEAELSNEPTTRLSFIFCDLPHWVQHLNRTQRLVQLHYYCWQFIAYLKARKLHCQIRFDLVHHVTYVKYWAPSFLSLLPLPFVWGPVGGGESFPRGFLQDFSLRGNLYEALRRISLWLGELDPFVRLTASRSTLTCATSADTATRTRLLGSTSVRIFSQVALSDADITQLGSFPLLPRDSIKFVSIGRLLHWKGFHLGLRAFAVARFSEDVEYWIVGDGPERQRLQAMARKLGIVQHVRFFGQLSRHQIFHTLSECSALIHPSLHESGGLVCLEAMAAGCPVMCLDLGGPAIHVTEGCGFKIPAISPFQAIRDLASAMEMFVRDSELQVSMSQAARDRVFQAYQWTTRCQYIMQLYRESIVHWHQLNESKTACLVGDRRS